LRNGFQNGANAIRSEIDHVVYVGQRGARQAAIIGKEAVVYVVCGTTIIVVSAAGLSILYGAVSLGMVVAGTIEGAAGSIAGTVATIAPYGTMGAIMVGAIASGADSEKSGRRE